MSGCAWATRRPEQEIRLLAVGLPKQLTLELEKDQDLRGRFLKVVTLQRLLSRQPVVLGTPHQLEISD